MNIYYIILMSFVVASVLSYSTDSFSMFGSLDDDDEYGLDCSGNEEPGKVQLQNKLTGNLPEATTKRWSFRTIAVKTHAPKDPYEKYQHTLNQLLFGSKIEERDDDEEANIKKLSFEDPEVESDPLAQFPSGSIMRAEVFQNKTSVHLPSFEFMHRGHLFLQITNDYMQTAVNAFSILLRGNLQDVLRLPAGYVLKSAKTIAMMKIAKEKLAATWAVVKGNNLPVEISSIVLEMYRPLFKYLNGKEMARLNLSDEKILTFIGTHSDLDRHQVGVVASKYIRLNDRWMEPKYLNMMNNILCGVPMTFMRKVPESTFLQLTHQLFYHIRACDPLQRRFYLAMMTKTQALGKSYSWSARDVSRLGLLLTEVEGPDLAAVNPEAMSGITAQVMLEIPAATLKHITEMQLRYIEQKPLNILAKKLRIHQDQEEIINNGQCSMNLTVSLAVLILLTQVIK